MVSIAHLNISDFSQQCPSVCMEGVQHQWNQGLWKTMQRPFWYMVVVQLLSMPPVVNTVEFVYIYIYIYIYRRVIDYQIGATKLMYLVTMRSNN